MPPNFEDGMDKELAFHLEQATQDYIAAGMSPDEARSRARRDFGTLDLAKEEMRGTLPLRWWRDLLQDVRHAIRGMRRDAGFTFTAIATLAISLGFNVTVFSVMDTMLFRGYPLVERNDRLLYMQEIYPQGQCCISYPDFEDWRKQAKSFQDMAFVSDGPISFSDTPGQRPVNMFTATLSNNAFGVLGVRPVLGRDFAPADEAPGAAPVAILNYRFWVAHFSERPDIVGLVVRINNAPTTIIGVMPEGFDFPAKHNLWRTLQHTPETNQRIPSGYLAFGRLAEGVTAATARAELETINRNLAAAFPATNRDVKPRVDNFAQFNLGRDASVVYGSLWAAAWFVLLIACANLANLTLARTLGSSREYSTRLALGASHWRVIKQVFTEGALIASIAGFLAVWIAKWCVRAWAAATESQYQILDYSPSAGIYAYLAAVTVAAAVLISLVPISRVLHLDWGGMLKEESRGATQGSQRKYLSGALIGSQMALAIILLSGAGVLVRSFLNVANAPTGVTAPERVYVGWITLPRDEFGSPESRLAFFDTLRQRLRSVPGVESAAIAVSPPGGNMAAIPFELDGLPLPPQTRPTIQAVATGPDYFVASGAATIAGRDFVDADRPNTPPVAIVNQKFAEKYWPGQNPIGKRVRLFSRFRHADPRTVVGVVSDIRHSSGLQQEFVPVLYVPFRQEPSAQGAFLARVRAPSPQIAAGIRKEVEKVARGLDIEEFSTLKDMFAFRSDLMDIQHVEIGKHAAVAPIFAILALLLAAIGLYAVIAHSVGQRMKEIGIRIALGAESSDILGMIFREGMAPVAIGLLVGLGASLGANRVLQSQLVGVSPNDPSSLALASSLLVLLASLGCLLPARGATRIDPATVLRND